MPPAISQNERAILSQLLGGDVSRETEDTLAHYADMLEKWQNSVNLVSSQTISALWSRHIIDSAQIIPLLGNDVPLTILDIGSGAGFPGLVVALLTAHEVHLVESDAKKSAFLRRVIGETGARATVHTARIEHLSFMNPDVITARALAPLDKLLELTQKQHHDRLRCVFLKGRSAQAEIDAIAQWSHLKLEISASVTDQNARILSLSGF